MTKPLVRRSTVLTLFLGVFLVALACSAEGGGQSGFPATPASVDGSAVPPTPTNAAAQQLETPPSGSEPPPAPTGPPPKLDTSIASVPLEEVLYDTFRGGFIRLSEASQDDIDRLRDTIAPVYSPEYDDVEGGRWLNDDDAVIGYVSDSGAYAYPVKILNLHEIVNDVIDGVPVLVTYCPLCASGVVYSRDLDGEVLLFGNTSALYESDLVMYDHQTGSYSFQVIGEAIVGPATGRRLALLPSMTTTWASWTRLHPDTKVLQRPGPGARYRRDPFLGYEDSVNKGRFAFPVTKSKLDGRLRAGDKVLAVEVEGSHKAYALTGVREQAINDIVGDQEIVVIVRLEGPTGAAYWRTLGDRTLRFTLTDRVMKDMETGSLWDDSGRAISGPLAGSQLEPVPSRTSFWFSLVGSLPGVDLYMP